MGNLVLLNKLFLWCAQTCKLKSVNKHSVIKGLAQQGVKYEGRCAWRSWVESLKSAASTVATISGMLSAFNPSGQTAVGVLGEIVSALSWQFIDIILCHLDVDSNWHPLGLTVHFFDLWTTYNPSFPPSFLPAHPKIAGWNQPWPQDRDKEIRGLELIVTPLTTNMHIHIFYNCKQGRPTHSWHRFKLKLIMFQTYGGLWLDVQEEKTSESAVAFWCYWSTGNRKPQTFEICHHQHSALMEKTICIWVLTGAWIIK